MWNSLVSKFPMKTHWSIFLNIVIRGSGSEEKIEFGCCILVTPDTILRGIQLEGFSDIFSYFMILNEGM